MVVVGGLPDLQLCPHMFSLGEWLLLVFHHGCYCWLLLCRLILHYWGQSCPPPSPLSPLTALRLKLNRLVPRPGLTGLAQCGLLTKKKEF